jgi:hypothetical protein
MKARATRIAQFTMAARGMDPSDEMVPKRIIFSVKDVRKRMTARGV